MRNLLLASLMAMSFVSLACASDEIKTEAPAAEVTAQATSVPEAAQQRAESAKTETAPETK